LSRQQKDEEYTVTVDMQLPKDYVHEAEIRLITANLGELLKRVIRDTESIKE
jgi:hypothetical protein